MNYVPANFTRVRHLKFAFNPVGKKVFFGPCPWSSNPRTWKAEQATWAARFFVGLSVFNAETEELEPRYEMKNIIEFVKHTRLDQAGMPDASFIAQKGLFTHEVLKQIVEEDSVQVLIIFMPTSTEPDVSAFIEHMRDLAERLAGQFEQEEVILEVQENGITKMVEGWTA